MFGGVYYIAATWLRMSTHCYTDFDFTDAVIDSYSRVIGILVPP